MRFLFAKLLHFRNLEECEISFDDSNNVFLVGTNGQGKTNFLEALYYLCRGSSFRTKNDKRLIRIGEESFAISGTFYDENEENNHIRIFLSKEGKNIFIDGKRLNDRRELVHQFPCIVFAHEDFLFIKGEPENQRFFFDQTSVLTDLLFLDLLRNYKKVLKNRNILLSQHENSLTVEVWEEKLALYGLKIMEKRQKLSLEIANILKDLFQKVFGSDLSLELRYHPSWKKTTLEGIKNHLLEKREQDFSLRCTSSGPHRDRFTFFLGGKNVQETASTGQVRLISLLLRLIQAKLVLKKTGKRPILLLDDVLLELDQEKKEAFLKELPLQSQTISTFLPRESVIEHKQAVVLKINEGRIT